AVLPIAEADAASFGTRDEAVAMVKRVQDKFKRDGAQATFAAINAQAREFHDRDLYVYVLDRNCVIQANAARKELVGKSLYDFRDQDGIYPARNTVDIAMNKGRGWTDYRWTNPKTNQIEAKSTYVERLGDGYAVGVGIYKDEQVNQNIVSIISGSPGSDATYLQVAYDLASVLHDEKLRLLPLVGMGGPQNIRDVRNLRGIAIGLTQISILNNFRRSNELLGITDDKIVYISRLFSLETHVVARTGVTSLQQLDGQKVNLDEIGSGTNYSMRDVFKRLGINIVELNLPQSLAMEKLRTGEIAATVLVAGKPTLSMSRLRAVDGFTFVAVPFGPALQNDFMPARLTHDDYPEMIPPGRAVETIGDGAVIIAYNWPNKTDRYRRVESFINAFFPRIEELQKPPHHPKWKEVNLNSTIEGWTKLEAAQNWLNANVGLEMAEQRDRFERFLRSAKVNWMLSKEELFQEFLRWDKDNP